MRHAALKPSDIDGIACAGEQGQFEAPFGIMGSPTMFTIPVRCYFKTYCVTEEQLPMVAVVQRDVGGEEPARDDEGADHGRRRARLPDDRVSVPALHELPGHQQRRALILTSADRARDFSQKPVYILGSSESVETPMISQMADFTSSRAFRVAGQQAFDSAGIRPAEVDHLMIYDAFALPLYGVENLGFVGRFERARGGALWRPLAQGA